MGKRIFRKFFREKKVFTYEICRILFTDLLSVGIFRSTLSISQLEKRKIRDNVLKNKNVE